MKKKNLKNAYKFLAAYVTFEGARWPNSAHQQQTKEIIAKAERIRKDT